MVMVEFAVVRLVRPMISDSDHTEMLDPTMADCFHLIRIVDFQKSWCNKSAIDC